MKRSSRAEPESRESSLKSNDLATSRVENNEVPSVSNLQSIVEESKANLLNAESQPVKRGRGRPKGSTNKMASEPSTSSQSPVPGAVSHTATDSSGMGIQSLSVLVKMPFALRARTTGFENYRIDDPTATELAVAWDKALAPFIGAVNTPWGVLAMTVASTGMVIIAKEMELADYREAYPTKKQKEKKEENEAENEAPTDVSRETDFSFSQPPILASEFIPQHSRQ